METQQLPQTIEQYRHRIKLLKYHLKAERKQLDSLKYQHHQFLQHKDIKAKKNNSQPHPALSTINSLQQTVSSLVRALAPLGVSLGDLFRICDANYTGEITKEQFMRSVQQLKANISERQLMELFYAIDSSMNGLVDEDEFSEFAVAFGAATAAEARKKQKLTLNKYLALLKKKKGAADVKDFVSSEYSDPIQIGTFLQDLKKLGLSQCETILLLKLVDPSQSGSIPHKLFIAVLSAGSANSQKQDQLILVRQFCAQLREAKINPVRIWKEADSDQDGKISPMEFEAAFKKLLPGETTFKIRKFVALINSNNDLEISEEQFLYSMRAFYSLEQLDRFGVEAEKAKGPTDKKSKQGSNMPKPSKASLSTFIRQLNDRIDRMALTKEKLFHMLDINKDGSLSSQQIFDGLKMMGMETLLTGKLISLFDRDGSQGVEWDEWIAVLGGDQQMEEVPLVDSGNQAMHSDSQPLKPSKPTGKTKQPIKTKLQASSTSKAAAASNRASVSKPNNSKEPKNQKEQISSKASTHRPSSTIKPEQIKNKPIETVSPIKNTKQATETVSPSKTSKQPTVLTKTNSNTNSRSSIKQPQATKPANKNEQKKKEEQKPSNQAQNISKNSQSGKEISVEKASKPEKVDPKSKPNIQSSITRPIAKERQFKEDAPKPTPSTKEKKEPIKVKDESKSKFMGQSKSKVKDEPQNKQDPPAQDTNYLPPQEYPPDETQSLSQIIQKCLKQSTYSIVQRLFLKHDRRRGGTVKGKQFKAAVKQIVALNGQSKQIDQTQLNQLYQGVCVEGGIVKYEEWLKDIIGEEWTKLPDQPNDAPEVKKDKKQVKIQPTIQGNTKPAQNNIKNSINPKQTNQAQPNPLKGPSKEDKNKTDQSVNAQLNQILSSITNPLPIPIAKAAIAAEITEDSTKASTKQNRGVFLDIFKQILTDNFKKEKRIELSTETQKQLQACRQKVQSFKNSKKKFLDSNFPANSDSLTKSPFKSSIKNVAMLKWKHYSEIFEQPKLFVNSAEPNDILQGSLGDCYFLSALSCLAQYPLIVERMFEISDIESGYFVVWLCIDGEWKLIELDGMLPVQPSGNQLIFARTKNQQLWAVLLEKAYAKAYGCYENIASGRAFEAIRDLSGAPADVRPHKDISADNLWTLLSDANSQQQLMTCGTDANPGSKTDNIDGHSEDVTKEGIVLGHGYSILDLIVYNNEKLIQLRNPWGTIEWNGDWSDSSKKWTPQARQQLKFQSSDDGIFWMPFNHFFTRYSLTAINYLRPTYFYSRKPIESTNSLVVRIDNCHCKDCYLSIIQSDHRKLSSNKPPSYVLTRLAGFIVGKKVKAIGSRLTKYDRESVLHFEGMNNGDSLILMVSMQESIPFSISCYSDTNDKLKVEKNLSNDLELKLACLNEDSEETEQVGDFMRMWMSQQLGDKVLMCFRNVSGKPLKMQISMEPPTNLKILPPYGLKNKFELEVDELGIIKAAIVKKGEAYGFGEMSFSM